ncbi:MAG: PilZ domain-containing protein [Phycisphaerae bacterium]
MSMYAINLSWEQSNEILEWAIGDKTPLRATVRMARDWTEMPSEFLGGTPLKNLMVRKFPSPWTDKMLAGQLLPCSFRKGHRKYLFVSAVIDSANRNIGDKTEETYILSWPDGVQQVQRRLYFRAAVPEEMGLLVQIWPSVAAIDCTPSDPPIHSGRLIDISAGGTQVELVSSDALVMDQSYLMEIDLPQPEQPVLVQAQARRVQAISDTNQYRYGLQFLSLDHSPRGQDTLLRLARFTNYLRSLQPAGNVNSE